MRMALLLAATLAAWARPAGAAVVAFEFTGEVLIVNSFFESIVSLGSPAAGVLSYETEAADSDPDPLRGRYAPATLAFTIGSYAYTSDGAIYVYDDDLFDGFQFAGSTDGADPIGGLPLNDVSLSLVGEPALYGSDALPPAPPSLSDPLITEQPSLRLAVLPPMSGVTYQYAWLLTLPEPDGPAAALAAGAALVALARRRG